MEPIVNPPPPPPVPPTYGKPYDPDQLKRQTRTVVLILLAVLIPLGCCFAVPFAFMFWEIRRETLSETTGTRGAEQVWQLPDSYTAVAADGPMATLYGTVGTDLCRIDATGTETGRWTLPIEATRLRCAQLDGLPPLEVIATDGHRGVVALSSAGRALWQYEAPADVLDINAGALGGRTNAVAVGTKAGVFVLDSTGKPLFDLTTIVEVTSVCMTQAGGGATPAVAALHNGGTLTMWDRAGREVFGPTPYQGQIVVAISGEPRNATTVMSVRPDPPGYTTLHYAYLDGAPGITSGGEESPAGEGALLSAAVPYGRAWIVAGTSTDEVCVYNVSTHRRWGPERLVRQQVGGRSRPEVAWLETSTDAEPQFAVANGSSLTLYRLRR